MSESEYPEKLFSEVISRLKERSLRITRKRQSILGALLTFDRPASAEAIRERAGLVASDLVTVYRNLEVFEQAGVLQRVPLENGTHLFELTAPDEHYHHLVCRQCHQVERIDICLGDKLTATARAHGYSQIAHVIEVYGLCRDCKTTD